MITLSLNSYPAPSEQARSRLLEHEAVVVLPGQGEVKVLNEVGARIWGLIDGAHSVRDIASVVCAEYAVTPAEAEADTLSFLADLEQKGMITIQT